MNNGIPKLSELKFNNISTVSYMCLDAKLKQSL